MRLEGWGIPKKTHSPVVGGGGGGAVLGTARLKLIILIVFTLICSLGKLTHLVAFSKIAPTVDGWMYLRPSCIVFDSQPVHEYVAGF